MRTDVGFWEITIVIVVCMFVGVYIGRGWMEDEIVADCKKTNVFFADKNVYQCKKILP